MKNVFRAMGSLAAEVADALVGEALERCGIAYAGARHDDQTCSLTA